MPKDKKGDFDAGTVEDLRGMISKWVSIPFGVLVIFVAGGAINLSDYFLGLKDQLGFEPIHQEFIRWGVLFGYYGGILAGPIVDALDTTISFVVTAILGCGGYIALAFYTDAGTVGTMNAIVIVCLVLFVAFNSAIASICAITTIIKNFSRNVGSMISSVLIMYYFLAPWFDTIIRKGYFEEVELKKNMIATGVIQFVVFILAAFIVNENDQSPALKRASSITDRFGILIYASIAGAFIALIYFTCIVAEQYKIGVFLLCLFILVNFIALGFTIQALLGVIKKENTDNVGDEHVPPKKNYGQMLIDIRYWCMLFGTFLVVGASEMYFVEAASVAISIGKDEALGFEVMKAFWLAKGISILAGGLLAAIFVHVINGWLFAALASFLAMTGFALTFLAESGDAFFWISGFFVGAGCGGWWTIVPQIILDDAGKTSFEGLWGLTLSVNAVGFFAFERLFYWISEKTEPSEHSSCQGTGCFLIPFIIGAVCCLIAAGLCFWALSNDEGTGGAGGEKKPLRNNDKNKESGRKTREGRESKSSGRGKSKDKKRGKSRSKSKNKS